MKSTNPIRGHFDSPPEPIPFPAKHTRAMPSSRQETSTSGRANRPSSGQPESVDDILAAFDDMSRRITDLARELNCLGHFDDPNGDLPRAA